MRIPCVHNRYQQHGGEDQVFDSETALLEQYGHHVRRLEFDNDTISPTPSLRETLKLAINTVWSRESARKVHAATLDVGADVVHFTNTFPLASPSVYSAARSAGAATVHTIQNYRMACPSSNFYRDQHVCENCLGHLVPWPGVMHACYRNSRAQSAVVASMITAHRLRRTWQNEVDVFVAATEFSRRKLIEGGLPAEKVRVKPNFLESAPTAGGGRGDYCLFVGRLVEEKGVSTLLSAWSVVGASKTLRIAGTGPLEVAVNAAAAANNAIQPLGKLGRVEVLEEMLGARLLIFPSVWYEGLPVTLVEALACGLPVIASRMGAMSEVVHDGQTGLLFNPGDASDLAAKIRWAMSHPQELREMGKRARDEYEAQYTAERNHAMLVDIYQQALAERLRSRGQSSPE